MRRISLILVPCLALVAACGSGSSSAPSDTGPQTTVAPATQPPTTLAPAPTVAATAAPDTAAPDTVPVTEPTIPLPESLDTKGVEGPYDPGRDARADIALATQMAAAQGKLVLLDFGANWCPDCLVLDELYLDPAVATLLADEYVLVTIDVGEWDHNMDISADYNNAADLGIPALVVLQPDGTIIADTSDGSFASASGFSPADVAAYLQMFVS